MAVYKKIQKKLQDNSDRLKSIKNEEELLDYINNPSFNEKDYINIMMRNLPYNFDERDDRANEILTKSKFNNPKVNGEILNKLQEKPEDHNRARRIVNHVASLYNLSDEQLDNLVGNDVPDNPYNTLTRSVRSEIIKNPNFKKEHLKKYITKNPNELRYAMDSKLWDDKLENDVLLDENITNNLDINSFIDRKRHERKTISSVVAKSLLDRTNASNANKQYTDFLMDSISPQDRKLFIDKKLGIEGGKKEVKDGDEWDNWEKGNEHDNKLSNYLAGSKYLTDEQADHIKRHGDLATKVELYENPNVDPKHGAEMFQKWNDDESHKGYDQEEFNNYMGKKHDILDEEEVPENVVEELQQEIYDHVNYYDDVANSYSEQDFLRTNEGNRFLRDVWDEGLKDEDYEAIGEKLSSQGDWTAKNPDYDPKKAKEAAENNEEYDEPEEIDYNNNDKYKIEDHPDFEAREQDVIHDYINSQIEDEKIPGNENPQDHDDFYEAYSESQGYQDAVNQVVNDYLDRAKQDWKEKNKSELLGKAHEDVRLIPEHLKEHIPQYKQLEEKQKKKIMEGGHSGFLDQSIENRTHEHEYGEDQHLYEMAKDYADANGGSIDVGTMHKLFPNQKDKWKKIFGDEGKLSSNDIQEKINAIPKTKYDTSYGKWDEGQMQNLNKQNQVIFKLDHSPESLKPLLEDKELYDTFKKVQDVSKRSGHPTRDQTIGWARVDTSDPKHWMVDELQSDFGSAARDYLKREGAGDKADHIQKIIDYHKNWREALLNKVIKEAKKHGAEKVSTHTPESKAQHTGAKHEHSGYNDSYKKVPRAMGFRPSKGEDLPLSERGKQTLTMKAENPGDKASKHTDAAIWHNKMAHLYRDQEGWSGNAPDPDAALEAHHNKMTNLHMEEHDKLDPSNKDLVKLDVSDSDDLKTTAKSAQEQKKPASHEHDSAIGKPLRQASIAPGHTFDVSPKFLKKSIAYVYSEMLEDLIKSEHDYKISHNMKDGVLHVKAHNNGEEVGHAKFSTDKVKDKYLKENRETFKVKGTMPEHVHVDKEHRQKGVATKMYNHAEKVVGHKLTKPPKEHQTKDAEDFWGHRVKKNLFEVTNISKAELLSTEDVNPLMNRMEDKYFVKRSKLAILLSELKDRLAQGDSDTSVRYNKNRTIYMDNKDMDSFKDNMDEIKPRFKVRIRQYAPNMEKWEDVAYLELKVKMEDGMTKKIRVRIKEEMIDDIAIHGKELIVTNELIDINRDIQKDELWRKAAFINSVISKYGFKKQLEVQYERRAYSDNEIRITVDDKLEYMDTREIDRDVMKSITDSSKWKKMSANIKRIEVKDYVIVEVKHEGTKDKWVDELLDKVNAKSVRFSKYCGALITFITSGKSEGFVSRVHKIDSDTIKSMMDGTMLKSELIKTELSFERESEIIKENKKKPEAHRRHKFKAAKWTHPNGHPRCKICGDEERTGGICGPIEKSLDMFSKSIFDCIDLKKGAMKRLYPFNPNKDISEEERESVETWVGGYAKGNPDEIRQKIPQSKKNPLQRGLNKLHGLTDIKKDPKTGKRMFLLHRGASPFENDSVKFKGSHSKLSSWTPDLKSAQEFYTSSGANREDVRDYEEDHGRKLNPNPGVLSAWIPEDQIHYIPNTIGSKSKDVDQNYWDKDSLPKEPLRREEHEIIVKPHKLIFAKSGSFEHLQEKPNREQTLHKKITSKMSPAKQFLEDKDKAFDKSIFDCIDLKKGSLQSRLGSPLKSIPEKEQKNVEQWTGGVTPGIIENLPKMSKENMTRALNKLHGRTEVKKHPETGERMFLLHRGMGPAKPGQIPESASPYSERSSWTPDYGTAKSFSTLFNDPEDSDEENEDLNGHIYSAWIPESKIRYFVPLAANKKTIGSHNINESEVIVEPHKLMLANPVSLTSKQAVNKRISERKHISNISSSPESKRANLNSFNRAYKKQKTSDDMRSPAKEFLEDRDKAFDKSIFDSINLRKIEDLNKKNNDFKNIASDYAKSKNLALSQNPSNVELNPSHGREIANAYESMQHNPSDPHVKKSYNALIKETGDQFNHLLKNGLKVSKMKPDMGNPYKNSKDLIKDLKENNHMWYYPTELGFGTNNQPKDHPMLQETEFTHEGKKMPANDVFRVVHDAVHAIHGSTFGPKGEHQTYLTHKQLYSPEAQGALATETMGQNNWVNWSKKYGEHNRKNPSNTVFAEQKAGLLPNHILSREWHKSQNVESKSPAKQFLEGKDR